MRIETVKRTVEGWDIQQLRRDLRILVEELEPEEAAFRWLTYLQLDPIRPSGPHSAIFSHAFDRRR